MKTSLRWAARFGLALSMLALCLSTVAPGGVAQASSKVGFMVSSVSPDEGSNDLDVSITIQGMGFIATPQVLLGTHALQDVIWVSEGELEAVVPWGLLPGTYTVTVINPGGGQASLAGAYTVTNGFGNWISGGPYGGIVKHLSFGGSGFANLYATIPNVGLFRTSDSGQNWEMIFTGSGPENVLAVDPLQPQRMYMAQTGLGLYRSEDGGSSWTLASIPLEDFHFIYRLRAFPSPHSDTLYAAPGNFCVFTYCGLWKSMNHGDSWTQISGGDLATDTLITDMAFDPGNANTLWLGLYNGGVLRSTDGGSTWADMGQPMGHVAQITINPYTHEAWVTGSGEGFSDGIYKYSGDNWVGVIYQPIASEMWNTTQVAFGDNANIIWTAAAGTAWRTLDGGVNWDDTFDPVGNHAYSVVQDPNNDYVWYLGYAGQGVYRTGDGGANWEARNNGLAGVVPKHLAISAYDPAELIADTDMGLLHTTDGGASWASLPEARGGGDMLLSDGLDFGHFCINGFDNGLVCTLDLGENYDSIPLPVPATYTGVTALVTKAGAMAPGVWVVGSGFYDEFSMQHPAGGGWLYYSADGVTWNAAQIEDQYDTSTQTIHMVTSIAIDPQNSQIVYASTESLADLDETDPNRPGRLMKSIDGGHSWTAVQTTDPEQQWIVNFGGLLAMDPQAPYGMVLTCGSELYVSTDGGLTWNDFPVSLPTEPGNPLEAVHFVAYPGSSRFYLGAPNGLYYTEDLYHADPQWQRAEGRLGNLQPWAMASLVMRGQTERIYLYVSTIGGLSSTAKADELTPAGVYRFTNLFYLSYMPMIKR